MVRINRKLQHRLSEVFATAVQTDCKASIVIKCIIYFVPFQGINKKIVLYAFIPITSTVIGRLKYVKSVADLDLPSNQFAHIES